MGQIELELFKTRTVAALNKGQTPPGTMAFDPLPATVLKFSNSDVRYVPSPVRFKESRLVFRVPEIKKS